MKYFKYIYLLFLLPIQLFGASGEGSNHSPHLDGSILTIYWVIPFAGILLSIAIFPLIAPHFWHKNFGYGTKDHLYGLKKYGVTKHHRKKFKPVHNMLFHSTRETL